MKVFHREFFYGRPVSLLALGCVVLLISCRGRGAIHAALTSSADTVPVEAVTGYDYDTVSAIGAEPERETGALSPTERRLAEAGLTEIVPDDTAILVHLVYATPENFTGKVLYTDLRRAYLLPEAARMLYRASECLRRERPGLRLLIYDAARPMSVQREMWNLVKGTPQYIYVSNPANGGGLHNYGAAVDLTLADGNSAPLPMGTPFDYFGQEAHIDREDELVAQGRITQQELDNRLLLRKVMRQAGFRPLCSEWWHFNAMTRAEARERYRAVE